MPCCVPSINNENRRRTMKTKTIFKTLALATMMPAMLLTTACSSDDDAVNNEINNNGKGYALPVTINVTRGDDATTRATYNEWEKELEFSSGDQLFVKGTDDTAGAFAGTLEWQSGDIFSGTIYTEEQYSGTAVALLGSASTVSATLLPDGYGTYGFLTVTNGDSYSATLATNYTNAFATSKADGVAQLSLEQASTYSSGFALAPQNAILNFTAVTGEWGSGSTPASSSVSLQVGETIISGSVAPVEGHLENALANFAIAVAGSASPSSLTLTVDGTSVSLGSHILTAGKIYNQKCANINAISPYIQENEKWLVYGTGTASGSSLSIPEGATVTLYNVNLSGASIDYSGNNTIILADGTTNTVEAASFAPAIMPYVVGDRTLTIKGTGTLIATGGFLCPAIGPSPGSCGDITIESTVHLTATAGENYDKAITTGDGGGTLTIGGVVYDGGADSPFEYPTTAETVTWNFLELSGSYILNQGYTNNDNGVTLQGMGDVNFDMGSLNANGECTFTAPTGKKFTKIVINATQNANIIDWTNGGGPGNFTSTWIGDAPSVSFSGSASGITSIVFTTAPAGTGDAPAETGDETGDVTWNSSVMSGNHDLMEGFTRYGVTLSGPGSINGSLSTEGECTFIAPSGKKFTKIVISAMYSQIEGDGWTNDLVNGTSTWNGDASTVSFSGSADGVTSIVFTTAPAEGHVTWIFSEMASQYNGSVSIVNNQRFEHGGVTLSISEAGSCTLSFMGRSLNTDGTATFTAPDGKKFTSIVITANYVSINGFDNDMITATWESNSGGETSVSFSGQANGITSIVFTLEDE